MRTKYVPAQVLECPVSTCGFRLESPVRLTAAWCPSRHLDKYKHPVRKELKVIWDKSMGGEPPLTKG